MKARRQQKKFPSQPQHLRIIGGKWRSRTLDFPAAEGLRPTGDRIRETLFNWLLPHLPGAHCLDAFAGSGALGFEALSRGAERAVLVEKSAIACRGLEANRQKLGAGGAVVIQGDLLEWLDRDGLPMFDIVFVDPPFAQHLHERCLAALAAAGVCRSGALVYVESPADVALTAPAAWRSLREKRSGNVAYRLLQTT